MRNKAVVLGANYYVGLSIIRCLGREGVHVVAIDYSEKERYGAKSKYLSEKHIAPHYKDNPKGLLDFLINFSKKQDKKPVLYPGADPYVEFIDTYFDELKEHYLFPMDKKGRWTQIMDKYELSLLAHDHDVKVPETINSKDENLIERVRTEIKYPCIIKPMDSASFVKAYRRKVFFINSEEELKEKLNMIHKDDHGVTIQRIIPGPEENCYCYDAYLDQNSRVTHYTAAYKIRQWPNNFGASTYAKQTWIPELDHICKPFLEGIGFKGFAEIELKRDVNTGEIYLIEVNVRTINFNEMLCKSGLNFPYIAYQEMTDKLPEPKSVEYETGYVFHYMYEDLFAIRGYLKSGQMTWKDIVNANTTKKVHSTWSWEDPGPGLYFMGMVAGKIANRIKSKISK
ncbi:MAG: carboxylate--amine ligase [Tissierellia bacterium]|nr:carboxylate--amine ligase [Tissierellia bacterium]MDD4726125.1 carboxylate--amine ligase [Tissierellia bacterium]